MARASWSGALSFAGFPIHVRLYPRVKSRSGQSFKLISPATKGPVSQKYLDDDGNAYTVGECERGVEVAKGQIHPLPPDVLEAIGSAERSGMIEPEQFAPVESVPLALTQTAYEVRPDEKVPGSDQPYRIILNGLRKSGLAYMTEIVPRAGSRDSILAIWADEAGMHANALPYASELDAPPPFDDEQDAAEAQAQAETFQAFVTQQYADKLGAFDHAAYTSSYKERRDEAVQAALKGEKVAIPEVAAAQAKAPDLMAAMQASLAGGSAPAKKPAKKAKKADAPVKA